jgi:hypothetical protein
MNGWTSAFLSYALFGAIVFIAVVYLLDVLYDWWHLPRPRRRKGGTGGSPPSSDSSR